MSAIHLYITNQKARALSEGIKIVRNILKSNPFPNGFTTSQLFEVAIQQPSPPDFPVYRHSQAGMIPTTELKNKAWPIGYCAPTHPEHPIRSIRFLKVEVLPALANSNEIKMVKQNRLTVDDTIKQRVSGVEFVWRVVDPNMIPPPPRFKPEKEVVGREVGVDFDYGHLNKRRQNARVEKIARDVEAMKDTWKQERTTPKGSETP